LTFESFARSRSPSSQRVRNGLSKARACSSRGRYYTELTVAVHLMITRVCTSRIVRVPPALGRYIPFSTCGPLSVTSVCITMCPIIGPCAPRIVGKVAVVCCPSAHRLTCESKCTGSGQSNFIAAKICDAQSAAKALRSARHCRECYSGMPNVYRLHLRWRTRP
jgi:hypothetical protein